MSWEKPYGFLRLLIASLLLVAGVAGAVPAEPVLVMGATGRQGHAVVDQLLARGYRLRGMTRKPQGKKARQLAERGVEVVAGDYRDPDSLRAALSGAHGVFYYSGFTRDELGEGRNVIAAAKASGIRHFVYSSGAAAAPGKGMEGAAKMAIELELADSGIPFTVLRPVAFMENFRGQQARIAESGVVDSRAPDRKVYFIAIRDIGFFAAEAIEHPEKWLGRGEDIAADQMTLEELAAAFGRVMGREVPYRRQALAEYLEGFPPPVRPLFRWYDEVGYAVDSVSLRRRYPDLMTLEQYLRETGWENWRAEN